MDEQEHDLDTARTAADVQLQQAFVTEPQPLQQNRVAFSGAAMGMSCIFGDSTISLPRAALAEGVSLHV